MATTETPLSGLSPTTHDRGGRWAYFNGAWKPEIDLSVSVFDSGFATGDKVVEVMRTFAGRVHRPEDHLRRLSAGLAQLQIRLDQSVDQLQGVVEETLRRNRVTEPDDTDWQVIIYVSRGLEQVFALFPQQPTTPSLIVLVFPLTARLAHNARKLGAGIDLVVPAQPAIPSRLLPPHIKSRGRLDLQVARIQAHEICPGASAVLADEDGHITESTGMNVFFVLDGTLRTAPATDVVDGVMRRTVLELAADLHLPVDQSPLPLDAAIGADEAFLTATVTGIVHGRTFQGRMLGDGSCGPVTTAVRTAFESVVGVDLATQAQACAARTQRRRDDDPPETTRSDTIR